VEAAQTQQPAVDFHVGVEVAVKPACAVPDLVLGESGTMSGIDEALLGDLARSTQVDPLCAEDGRSKTRARTSHGLGMKDRKLRPGDPRGLVELRCSPARHLLEQDDVGLEAGEPVNPFGEPLAPCIDVPRHNSQDRHPYLPGRRCGSSRPLPGRAL
jgi:hypothetical protein